MMDVAVVVAVAMAVAMAVMAATHQAAEPRPPRWINGCAPSRWRAVEEGACGRVSAAIWGGIRTRDASDI